MTDLAIILVAWNVRGVILNALRTIFDDVKTAGLDALVYVVDNGSSDGTLEAIRADFPAVRLLAQSENLGFAAANNVALRELGFYDDPIPNPTGPGAVFLLNPDTLVQPGALRILWDALFSLPHAGLLGAQLAYEDGSFQHGAFGFPGLWQIVIDLFPVPGRLYESRLNGRYSRQRYSGGKPFPVDHPLGATMFLRREAIEETGLFDEQFFMYCEEIDWSIRIKRAGWQIYCVPQARITHLEGRSTSQVRPRSIVNLWSSRFRLYAKHYSPPKLAVARLLVRAGMQRKIRLIQRDGSVASQEREALVRAYEQVIAMAASGSVGPGSDNRQ